jgi:hypothetical protein
MTRVNVGIEPWELNNQLLFTEYKEIVRIPNAIAAGRAVLSDIPEDFKLGEGHVKFFYNKLTYLHRRWLTLKEECIKRGINITNYSSAFESVSRDLPVWGDYTETPRDRAITLCRFAEKGHQLLD